MAESYRGVGLRLPVAACADGLVRTLQIWPLVLLLHAVTSGPAVLAAFLLAAATGDPVTATLLNALSARPLDLNAMTEVNAALAAGGLFPESGAGGGGPQLALLVPPLGHGLLYTFLSGGLIDRLRAAAANRQGFLPSCLRWFWPFFRLGVMAAFALLALLLAGTELLVLSFSAGLGVLVAGVLLLDSIFEWARAAMVLGGAAGARAGVRQALGLLFRRLPWTLVLVALLALPSLAVLAAQWLVGTPAEGNAVTGLVAGQVAALLGTFTKTWRLASGVSLWERAG